MLAIYDTGNRAFAKGLKAQKTGFWAAPAAARDRRGCPACRDPEPQGSIQLVDEGPSPEDLERFGAETAFCPQCGAEVWDEAPRCAQCGGWLAGETVSRTPEVRQRHRRWLVAVALLALVAFLAAVLRLL